PNGETTLMYAARNGSPAAIRTLLAAGAEVNATEGLRGTTALMWAVEQKHPSAVKALLDGGADVSMRSGPAGLPRNYMALRVLAGNVEAAQQRRAAAAAAGRTYQQQLEDERSIGIKTGGRGVNPTGGQRAPVGAKPAPDQPDADGDVLVAGLVGTGGGGLTALVFAAREGDRESARLLIEGGADVNQTTEYGWTP